MKLEVALNSGFCMGVRNAILRITDDINKSEEDIYVYGPLIHNPQTLDVLDKRGLKIIDNLEDIKDKQIAVRTHGIPYDENLTIKKESSRMINLTCPRVARVQGIIKKHSNLKYFTIIVGDSNHAEVVGLKSYAKSGLHIISKLEDIDTLPKADKYILVSQTTLDKSFFNLVEENLNKKYKNITIFNTICDSTKNRQSDVLEAIERGIDTLIVVGGQNSANTTRLAQIGNEHNIKTFHIETEKELNENNFKNSKYVLITAGASTPGWIINNVLEKLYDIKYKNSGFLINRIKLFLEFIIRSNFLSAIGAFFMSLLAQKFLSNTMELNFAIISFCYIFSMYSINNYLDKDTLKASNSYKYIIYKKFGLPLLLLSLILTTFSIYLSLSYSILITVILSTFNIIGFLYSSSIFKTIVNKLNISFLKRTYNSKIITSFGWVIVTVILPLFWYKSSENLLAASAISLFIINHIFVRHNLLDIVAFQGDLILGRETLPIWIGPEKVKNISIISSIITGIFFTTVIMFFEKYLFLFSLINLIYFIFLLFYLKRMKNIISFKYELIVDFNYILVFILYLIIKIIG